MLLGLPLSWDIGQPFQALTMTTMTERVTKKRKGVRFIDYLHDKAMTIQREIKRL